MRVPRVTHLVILIACVAAFAGSTTRAQPQRVFSSIDAPNASFTNAQGINAPGDIVGFYVDKTNKRSHGFLLEDGAFTTIDYPNAVYTDARGINARGEIVGSYRMAGEPPVNFHGYLRSPDGQFTQIDFPGHTNTIPQRITSTGLVVGCRHDYDTMDTMRGVMINSRDTSQVAEIGAYASMNNGATPDGQLITGLFTDMDTGKGRGYLLYGDTFIPFDAPGSIFTAAWDANTEGSVVGVYRDTGGKFHGFVWENLMFTAIDYQAAAATRAFGINTRGDIVGAYVDAANATHGFIAAKPRDDQ